MIIKNAILRWCGGERRSIEAEKRHVHRTLEL
jgi:hypothetical protein